MYALWLGAARANSDSNEMSYIAHLVIRAHTNKVSMGSSVSIYTYVPRISIYLSIYIYYINVRKHSAVYRAYHAITCR